MLDHDTRTAILRLGKEGHGTRTIAKALSVSRESVRKVLASGQAEVPAIVREDQLTPHGEQIRVLHVACGGNLVRVQEELKARHGVEVAYSTLTRFCREAEIGVTPKQAAGRYEFEPGKEMQHDTSPHVVTIGGRKTPLQCASLVKCFSRRRFIQCYPRWTRFHAKVFFTRALRFFGSASATCMLDNSTIIMTGGTGAAARPVPEMAAFSERFGFKFIAHGAGDANRSARVEAPFWHVEINFYAGRTFSDLADLNAQAVEWCRTYNATFHKPFGIPDELGVLERLAEEPLPIHVPEPTNVHLRRVDTEGYVRLHTNRYSVPEEWIGRELVVHETIETVRVYTGHRILAEHGRREEGACQRVTLPEHRRRRSRRAEARPPSPEELALRAASPAMSALCEILRQDAQRGRKAVLRLFRIWRDYPPEAVAQAVVRALEFGLADPARIERMVLKSLHDTFFNLQLDEEGPDGR